MLLTPGQAGDNPQLLPLLEVHKIQDGSRFRLLADKTYSHPSTRSELRSRRIKHTIPERSDQIQRRKAKGLVGVFLALSPFDHVVVSALHLLAGLWLGGGITYAQVGMNVLLATSGNLVGGLLLTTLTHTAQAKEAKEANDPAGKEDFRARVCLLPNCSQSRR